MDKETISVRTKDQKIYELDERLVEFSSVLKNALATEEIDLAMIESSTLDFIYQFYKKFDFKPPQFKKEVKSNNLQAVLGEIYYEVFKPFVTTENIIDLDKIKPIIDGCYFYDFKEIKDLCLMAIGSAFYFNKISEFQERWKNHKKTLTSAEKFNLIKNYENAFKKLLMNYLGEKTTEFKK